jgi:hypothetical protein
MQKKGGDTSCRLASGYGRRSSAMAWKILAVGAAVFMALTYNNREEGGINSPVQKIEEQFKVLQIKAQLEAWFDLMRETPVLRLVGKTGNGEKGGIRMFENCIADIVVVAENTVKLIDVQGDAKAEFGDDSFCGNALGIASIEGVWDIGGLDGSVNITYSDGRYMEAVFRRGVIWGIVKTFRCLYGPCNVWEEEATVNHDIAVPKYLESLSEYRAGRPASRPAWWFPVGGGAIFCRPDSDGLPDGEGCSYIYQDWATVLVGEWVSGRMRVAVEGKLENLDNNEKMLKPEIQEIQERLDREYGYDLSSSTVISSDPLLEDPFEQKTVYVAESALENAGEGLFLRRDLASGDLAALYNGVRMSESEARIRKDDRRSPYRIHGWNSDVLNIPTSSQDTETYCATLGHKANHAKKANSEYRYVHHPRFGEIVGLFMLEDAVAGQEVVVDYGYIEKFMATEAGINMMLEAAQAMSGITNKNEFKMEMKRTIGYVRDKVNDLKPFLNTFKMARNFMS